MYKQAFTKNCVILDIRDLKTTYTNLVTCPKLWLVGYEKCKSDKSKSDKFYLLMF